MAESLITIKNVIAAYPSNELQSLRYEKYWSKRILLLLKSEHGVRTERFEVKTYLATLRPRF